MEDSKDRDKPAVNDRKENDSPPGSTASRLRLRFFEWLPMLFVLGASCLPGNKLLGLMSMFLVTTVAMLLDIGDPKSGRLVTIELAKKGAFPSVCLLVLLTAGLVIGLWQLLTSIMSNLKVDALIVSVGFITGLTWSAIMGGWVKLHQKEWKT